MIPLHSVRAARSFATRILHEAPEDTRGRIAWAWQQALARPATPEELQTLTQLFEKQLAEFTADPDAARAFIAVGMNPPPKNLSAAELAAWTDIARAILNLHETITRS